MHPRGAHDCFLTGWESPLGLSFPFVFLGRGLGGLGLFGGVARAALLRGEHEVAVHLLGAHAAEDGGQLVAVPQLALDHQHQLSAHLEAIKALFNELFGDGKVRVVGRVGQDPVEIRRIHRVKRVAADDVHPGHAVAGGVFPGAAHGLRIDVRQPDVFRAQAPRRRDALKIIGCTYLAAVAAGIVIDLIF